jgi:hypothetical protein
LHQHATRYLKRKERVIESSYLEHLSIRIVSSFVVGDCDDESKTQRKEHLRSCVDAASGADVPKAAVFDRIIRSLNLCLAVVHLI